MLGDLIAAAHYSTELYTRKRVGAVTGLDVLCLLLVLFSRIEDGYVLQHQ